MIRTYYVLVTTARLSLGTSCKATDKEFSEQWTSGQFKSFVWRFLP